MDVNTRPPVLGQTQPVYPPPVQLIRVTGSVVQGPGGYTQVLASSVLGPLLYIAFTQQMRTDGSLLTRDREPCLADDVRGFGATPGLYIGRLTGVWTSLPVYEIISGVDDPALSTTYQVVTNVCAQFLTGPLGLSDGGTGVDLSGTGGPGQYLKQDSIGGNIKDGNPWSDPTFVGWSSVTGP